MPSENQRRHSEVQAHLAATDGKERHSPVRSYWTGSKATDLEREHAREEAAIETRLARMRSRGTGFRLLQTQ
jgi:hypothetical protein